jgi:hypothetical protein
MTAGKSRRHPHGPAQPALCRLVRMERAGLKNRSRAGFYSLSILATCIALTRATPNMVQVTDAIDKNGCRGTLLSSFGSCGHICDSGSASAHSFSKPVE